MQPPVALLTYVPDEPARAAFYPFARFSPEWRAIRYALDHDVPVRFMDLPAANKLAARDERAAPRPARRPARPRSPRSPATATRSAGGRTSSSRAARDRRVRGRHRGDGRAARGVPGARPVARSGARRTCASRSARRPSTAPRTSRSCAARGTRPRSTDSARPRPTSARCKGLPKVKVAATWVPWTYGLLARAAATAPASTRPPGTTSSSTRPSDPVARWLAAPRGCCAPRGSTRRAAQVVDAARLASALAGVRDRPLAGPRRAARCHPRRALPRQRRPARARARRAGRRRPPRRGPRRHADGPAPAGRRPPPAPPAAQAGGERKELTLDLRRETTASAAASCTA